MKNTAYPTSIPKIDHVTELLCAPSSVQSIWKRAKMGNSMPSIVVLQEIMDRLRAILFPGYFGNPVNAHSLHYHLAANIDSVYHLLSKQIELGLCFVAEEEQAFQKKKAQESAMACIDQLPTIRTLLSDDAEAAYEGDPAANSAGETIFCYPSMYAMTHQRIAHVLFTLQVPLIPRIIAEMAHSATGIDIHPGATIGKHFFIDHGTGVVIGETAIVGDNCRLYQGVTLGALSFPKNPDGTLTKGIPRHPVLGNNVTVYAQATILGRVHIGDGCVIGGNVWVTEDIPAGSKVLQERKN
ncbi:MAG: serine acetyltransferase [Desulfovibrio sp.]|nr:serine acetyltransferase [Desulfovibrio sp.]